MALAEAAVAVLEHDRVRALEPRSRVTDLDPLDLRAALDDLLDVGPPRELREEQAHVGRRPPKEGDLAAGERLVHPDAVRLAVRDTQPGGAAPGLLQGDAPAQVEPAVSRHHGQFVDANHADVPQAEPVEDRRARLRNRERGGDRSHNDDCDRDRDGPAPGGAAAVASLVGDDLKQPGPKRRAWAKAPERPVRLDEPVLRGLLGIALIARDDERGAKRDSLVCTYELLIGASVSAASPL